MKKLIPKFYPLFAIIIFLLLLSLLYGIILLNSHSNLFQKKENDTIHAINDLFTELRRNRLNMGRHQNNYLLVPNRSDSLKVIAGNVKLTLILQKLHETCRDSLVSCADLDQLDTLLHKNLALFTTVFQSKLPNRYSRQQILAIREKTNLLRDLFFTQIDKAAANTWLHFELLQIQKDKIDYANIQLLTYSIFGVFIVVIFLSFLIYHQLILKKNFQKRYQLFEKAGDGLLETDTSFRIIYANQKISALFNKAPTDLTGVTIGELMPSLFDSLHAEIIRQSLDLQEFRSFEYNHSSSSHWFRINLYPFEKGLSLTFQNINELKQVEIELQKSRKLYEFISKANDLILHIKTEETLYPALCHLAVTTGDFLLSWVGKPDENYEFIQTYCFAGKSKEYVKGLKIAIAEVPEGLGPGGRAFRSGKYYYCNDIAGDPIMKPWRDKALANHLRSSISLPIKIENMASSVITLYAPEPFFFTTDQIQLLDRVMENVSFVLTAHESDRKRKEAEQQLLIVNEAIEQSHSSVVITHVNGDIQYINPAFTKLTGYTPDEVISKNPRVLKTGHTSDAAYSELWKTITNGKVWKGEFLNKKKNGETYWEFATISPIVTKDGTITHFVAVKENITVRKKLEAEQQKLLSIIENSSAYMGTCDLAMQFTYGNQSLKNVLEIGNEDITQFNIADFRPKDYTAYTRLVYESLTAQGKWMGENKYVSRSGREIPVMQVVMLHKDKQGLPAYVSTTAIDLSDIKKAEKELQRLNDELRNFTHHLQYVRETEKNTITKEIHDNLGQGLASLKMDAAWIKKHLHDDPAILDTKMDELLQSISEKLAAFNKIYLSVNTSMIDEIGLMASVQYQAALFTKNYEIPVSLHSNMDHERIRSDQGLTIYRIVLEALSNIHQHAHATQVTLTLLLEADKLHLTIRDNGKGFHYQAVDTQKHHGLIEIRERVLSMNGKLFINSQIHKGTTLTIEVKVNRK